MSIIPFSHLPSDRFHSLRSLRKRITVYASAVRQPERNSDRLVEYPAALDKLASYAKLIAGVPDLLS
jgi:hypothetical protein